MGRASAPRIACKLVGVLTWIALAGLTLGVFFKPEPLRVQAPPSPADLTWARLQQIISLDVTNQPLEEVLAELEREHGLRIELDRQSLEPLLLPSQKVALRLRDARLGSAIALLLMQLDSERHHGLGDDDRAEYGIVGDGVRIVSADDARKLDVTTIYPVPPWLAADRGFSEEQLAAAIYSPPRDVPVLPGALVVTGPHRVHDEVVDVLGAIARVAEAPFAPPPKEPSPAEAAIARAMTERTDVDFKETPFAEVLAALAKRHRLNIVIDPARIAEANVSPSTPITFRAPGITLRAALQQILNYHGLAFVVEHDAVIVTSKEVADTRLVSRVYSARDLMSQKSYPPVDDLRELITNFILPETWKDAGGPATLMAVPGGLLVNAPAETHEELPRFLAWLRRALDPFAADYDALNRSPAELRLHQALGRNVSLNADNATFKDVISALSDQAGVPLVISQKKIEEANVQLDTPITQRLRDVPLRTALHAMLRDLGLDFIVRDEVILITSKEEQDTYITGGIYRYGTVGIEPHQLRDMLTTYSIHAESWKKHGGPGTASIFGDVLVIRTTRDVHEDCQELLAALTQMRDTPTDSAAGEVLPIRLPAERRLYPALDRKVSLEVKDSALKDVIAALRDQAHVPLVISRKRIEEANVQLDTPVTKKLQDLPLRAALQAILHDLGLDFVVRDGLIVVTSKEESDTYLTLGIYRHRPVGIEPRRLRSILTGYIRPDSWIVAGGPGTVSTFDDFLFIVNTRRVHEECQELLTKLAQFRSRTADRAASEAERERWLLQLQRQKDGPMPLPAPPSR